MSKVKFRWNNDNTKYLDINTIDIFIEILMQETIENFKEEKPVNSPINYDSNFTAIIINEKNRSKSKLEISVNLSYEFTGKKNKQQNNIVCRYVTPDGVLHENRMTIQAIKGAFKIRRGNLIKLVSGYPSNTKQSNYELMNTIKLFLTGGK